MRMNELERRRPIKALVNKFRGIGAGKIINNSNPNNNNNNNKGSSVIMAFINLRDRGVYNSFYTTNPVTSLPVLNLFAKTFRTNSIVSQATPGSAKPLVSAVISAPSTVWGFYGSERGVNIAIALNFVEIQLVKFIKDTTLRTLNAVGLLPAPREKVQLIENNGKKFFLRVEEVDLGLINPIVTLGSKLAAAAVVHPLSVSLTRLIVSTPARIGFFATLKSLGGEAGLRGIFLRSSLQFAAWHGLNAHLAHVIARETVTALALSTCLRFVRLEPFKLSHLSGSLPPEHLKALLNNMIFSTSLSITIDFVVSSLLLPVSTLRYRLEGQGATEALPLIPQSSLFSLLLSIAREEGAMALFKGFDMQVVQLVSNFAFLGVYYLIGLALVKYFSQKTPENDEVIAKLQDLMRQAGVGGELSQSPRGDDNTEEKIREL